MIYLLDTNAFSDLMRDHPIIRQKLNVTNESDQILTCAIVRGEIFYGISRLSAGKRRDDLTHKAEHLFAVLPCIGIVPAVAQYYADLKVASQLAGLILDENDLWIAATAIHLGAVIVTRDRDFYRLKNLAIEDWTANSGK